MLLQALRFRGKGKLGLSRMCTELLDDRESGLKVGYEATDWTTPVSYEAYCEAMKDWEVKSVVRDGEIIGAAYFKDDEVHASILPQWRRRWATKGIIQELFASHRMTKVTPGHEYMYGILTRLGFENQGGGRFVKG